MSKSIKNGQVKTRDLAVDAIGSDKIADATIRGADLAAAAISSDKIAEATIRGADLAAAAVSSDKIADATIRGVDLAEGSVGAGSLGTIETYFAASPATSDADGVANGGDHGVTFAVAACPAGSVPISGGAIWVDPSNDANGAENFYLQASRRVTGGWLAIGIVDMGAQGTIRLRTYVDCLMPAGYVPS